MEINSKYELIGIIDEAVSKDVKNCCQIFSYKHYLSCTVATDVLVKLQIITPELKDEVDNYFKGKLKNPNKID